MSAIMSELFCMIPCSYNKRFKVSTCKTLLKKTIVDAEKLIKKKEKEIKEIREGIPEILWTWFEPAAHYRITTMVDQKNWISVLQYVIYFAGQVARHLPLIASQTELPLELKEAVASLCYVGSRYIAIPALYKLVSQFSIKYGEKYSRKFMANVPPCKAAEYCGVQEQIPELMLAPHPPLEERNKLLQEIANEFNINWKPRRDSFATMPHDNIEIVPSGMDAKAGLDLDYGKLVLQDNMEIVPSRMDAKAGLDLEVIQL